MASNKLIIQTVPSANDSNGIMVYIDHNDKSLEVYSDEQNLVDFYSSIISESSISKEVPTDKNALLRIVSSMYGGTVTALSAKDFTEDDFNTAIKKAGKSKKITL